MVSKKAGSGRKVKPLRPRARPRRPAPAPAARDYRVGLTAGCLLAVMLLTGLLLLTAQDVARSQGGGIDPQVRGTGTASRLQCSRWAASLWIGWVCQAEQIDWSSRQLPSRVEAQQPPYQVLARADLSGQSASVASHVPSGWMTAGSGLRSLPPREVIVVAGHPVGASGWWTAQVFAPPAVLAGLLVAGALVLRRRR